MREIKLNREIKFRGQQINTKQWVYGYLYREKGLYLICDNIRYAEEEPVLIDTVGQYTGLKDKNGVEIYEGDIVQNVISDEKAKVEWSDEDAMFVLISDNVQTDFSYEASTWWEVVGNIYDK